MLKHLLIQNYVLIESLEIEPSQHLNIITGETGAGKSIMLGALGLLMGKRAEGNAHYKEGEKCIVEATFDISKHPALPTVFEELELDYEPTAIMRREISPSGKSRAFINDTPANLEALKKVGSYVMDIHSQHDTQQLGATAFQLQIVDAYAQNEQVKEQYIQVYEAFSKAEEALKRLKKESQQAGKEHDFNLHQLEELERAKLASVNQQAMEEELEVLENAELIKGNLNMVLDALSRAEVSSVEDSLKTALGGLQQLSRFGGQFKQLHERLNSTLIEILDINLEVEREESDLLFDHEQIQALKDQLDIIYTLQKKHQVESVQELLEVQEQLQAKIDKVLNFDEDLKSAEREREKAYEALIAVGKRLSVTRQEVMPIIEKELDNLLGEVGIPNGKVSLTWEAALPTSSGIDDIALLFSANKGIAPGPLKNAASGGEFSRLMLCIKYVLASKISMPTIIFDEIDTGVSGEVALRVGRMMEEMAKGHQLMAITHLPQIASKGDTHYFVYKDHSAEKSISRIRKLSEEDRVAEIAQMIGGMNPSEVAYQNARELIATK